MSRHASQPYSDVCLVREFAQRYRDSGIACIPITPGTKEPDYYKLRETGATTWLGLASIHRFNRVLPTVDELDAWFRTPAGIGIVAGFNKLVVLDFDEADAFEHWRDQYPAIANHTPVQRTRRGYHVFFRLMKRALDSRVNYNGTHCGDFRSRDWVVTAPSVHPVDGTIYHWLNERAPWETSIVEIYDLQSIGITQFDQNNWHRPIRVAVNLIMKRRFDRIRHNAWSGLLPFLHRYYRHGQR